MDEFPIIESSIIVWIFHPTPTNLASLDYKKGAPVFSSPWVCYNTLYLIVFSMFKR